MGELILLVVVLILVFFAGMATKGINININHKQEEKPKVEHPVKAYNQSTINDLPDDIRNYYEKNRGFVE